MRSADGAMIWDAGVNCQLFGNHVRHIVGGEAAVNTVDNDRFAMKATKRFGGCQPNSRWT
jgi:hypothetical protein